MKKTVIIGQGYVGLPLAQEAVTAGLSVVGLDLSSRIVEHLNMGLSHVDDISDKEIRKMLQDGYVATSDPSILAEAEIAVICVPTPLGDGGRPDLSAVIGACESISRYMNPGITVVLESTTYPGTTEEIVLPILERSGKVLDEHFWLAFSPERIDPGNPEYGLRNTPKIVGGVTPESTTKALAFYNQVVDQTVQVRSAKEAETAKLLENTYRHTNIALVNEMAKFCHELDIDLWDVIDAAKTKPFGFQAFYPGPGVGGHCIPIDPNYLSYEVKNRLGYPFRFVELAQEINNSMPKYIVSRVQDILNDAGKPLRMAKILLLGITYKANIADQRETPARPIAQLLEEKGAIVSFHDPRVNEWNFRNPPLERVTNLERELEEADLVVLLQNHTEYDLKKIEENTSVLFDTRGVSRSEKTIRL